MTERKPRGASFESWVEKQISEAAERGEFDNLPGAGKPIPGLDRPYEELWWLKAKMRRENLTYLPPSLQLRKDAENAIAAAVAARTEEEARHIIESINVKILDAIRKPLSGPPHNLVPIDVDHVLCRWREARKPNPQAASQTAPAPTSRGRRRFWWVRRSAP